MILDLNRDQDAFRRTAMRFARDVVAPRAAAIDETGEYPFDVIQAAAAEGLLGVTIPKEWGGAGRDYVSYALAIEAIARASATVAVALSINNSLVAELLWHAGRAAQKAPRSGRYWPISSPTQAGKRRNTNGCGG